MKRVFVLVDATLGPTAPDVEVLEFLSQNAISHQILFTKSDKCSAALIEQRTKGLRDMMRKKKIEACWYPHIFATSSTKKLGIDDVRVESMSVAHHLVKFLPDE